MAARVACVLVALAALLSAADARPSVSMVLNAKWATTPIELEACEVIAAHEPSAFWAFVDVVRGLPAGTDQARYEELSRAAERAMPGAVHGAFAMALGMRAKSPAVAADQRLAEDAADVLGIDIVAAATRAFAVVDGAAVLAAADLANLDALPRNTTSTVWVECDDTMRLFPFDHVHPGHADESARVAILYARVGSPEFEAFHAVLAPLALEGRVRYVLRHYLGPRALECGVGAGRSDCTPARMAGYGVELAIKNAEYRAVDDSKTFDDGTGPEIPTDASSADEEILGFRLGRLLELYPDQRAALNELRARLHETPVDLSPLKAWEAQDLGAQATQRIVGGDDPLRTMTYISQNLPSLVRWLSKVKVNSSVSAELSKNLSLHGIDGSMPLVVNGMAMDPAQLDPFQLLELLRGEAVRVQGLASLGLTQASVHRLMDIDVPPLPASFAIDMRSASVVFANDLEEDPQYARFPPSLQELLRPAHPQQLRYIRKNIFTAVFVVDPTHPAASEAVQFADAVIRNMAPVRLGFLLVARDVNDEDSAAGTTLPGANPLAADITRAFYHLRKKKSRNAAFKFLTELYRRVPSASAVTTDTLRAALGADYEAAVSASVSLGEQQRRAALLFVASKGIVEAMPGMYANGEYRRADGDIEQDLLSAYFGCIGKVVRDVYSGALTDSDDVYDHVMAKALPRNNRDVASSQSNPPRFVPFGVRRAPMPDGAASSLSRAQLAAGLLARSEYAEPADGDSEVRGLTLWVVGDYETADARASLGNILAAMDRWTRIAVVNNPSAGASTPTARTLWALVGAGSRGVQRSLRALPSLLTSALSGATVDDIAVSVRNVSERFATDFAARLSDEAAFARRLEEDAAIAASVFGLSPGELAIVANARIVGPLRRPFLQDDIALLKTVEFEQRINAFSPVVRDLEVAGLSADDDSSSFRSDLLVGLLATLGQQASSNRRLRVPPVPLRYGGFVLPPKDDAVAAIDVVAIVDPLSHMAQKLAPLLSAIHSAFNVRLRVLLNPPAKLSEVPIKRYYRYVIATEPQFDAEGKRLPGPVASFSGMPTEPLLTMGVDVPQPWLVECTRTPHDLDNIHLRSAPTGVYAVYELESIIIEGQCYEASSGNPTRGLQLNLVSSTGRVASDTLVMANLGYFQLKGNPGVWNVAIRPGRSSEVFSLQTADSYGLGDARARGTAGTGTVVVRDFVGAFMQLRARRNPGMERESLVVERPSDEGSEDGAKAEGEAEGGFWSSLQSAFGGGGSGAKKSRSGETINVFSVASGHLYERFLRVMMLSVVRNTKNPVKFWLLKNYLSPTFKESIPIMAAAYGFEYELVTYKWPSWLNPQTNKIRIIWGYKILFLDVLFPLDVKKIIFVDSDQSVRADLKELVDMDLHGAPYAYTPFCDDRPEMDGFKFWTQGYWKNHLQGRPYHISALYVVDLKRFRELAAGDRLRGQYQGLSMDPNSLANLDQDLPNNMIHQLPMHSLPQEWLWCETWCSDESKPRAKTIDLCNNPLTKEPKLNSALRILPEWAGLDDEIRTLLIDARNKRREEEAARPKVEL